jgi:hypothetical protein
MDCAPTELTPSEELPKRPAPAPICDWSEPCCGPRRAPPRWPRPPMPPPIDMLGTPLTPCANELPPAWLRLCMGPATDQTCPFRFGVVFRMGRPAAALAQQPLCAYRGTRIGRHMTTPRQIETRSITASVRAECIDGVRVEVEGADPAHAPRASECRRHPNSTSHAAPTHARRHLPGLHLQSACVIRTREFRFAVFLRSGAHLAMVVVGIWIKLLVV